GRPELAASTPPRVPLQGHEPALRGRAPERQVPREAHRRGHVRDARQERSARYDRRPERPRDGPGRQPGRDDGDEPPGDAQGARVPVVVVLLPPKHPAAGWRASATATWASRSI